MRVQSRIWTAIVAVGAATASGLWVAPVGVTAAGPAVMVSANVHHDTSAPLRSQPGDDRPWAAHPSHHSSGRSSPGDVRAVDTSRTSVSPRIPSTNANFNGIAANGSAPPDNEGAAGPTQYLEMANSQIAVYSKSGSTLLAARNTNTIWSGFGGDCQTHNDGDGTVLFDNMAQRWFIQQFTIDTRLNRYFDCLAVSTSSDATGTWNRYSFQYANFPDYPKTGVWPDAYYASFNLFNSAGTAGLGAELCAFNRAAMLSGASATQQCFMATASGEQTFLPGTLDGTTQPPAGSAEWFVALSSNPNALTYTRFHVDWTTPANSSLSPRTDLGVQAFSPACGGGTCIPQSGTGQQLDSLADRLMYRLAYRNFGDHEALVVNHAITAGASVGERWYELRPSGAALTVFQQGTVAPDSSYRWMGSIAMDRSGDMALGYSVSSSSLHPGIRYTGRLVGDAAGTMPQGEATVITGPGSQSGQSLSRWGDYTEMAVDPSDDCTFWYVNQYEPSTGAFNWQTRIASFKFPSCGATQTNDFSISANPSSVSTVQGGSATSTISTAVISGSAQTVSLSASGLPAGASASFNPTSVTAGGTSTLTIATSASTPVGTSTVAVTGTGTSATHATSVSLTVTATPVNDFSISASPSSVSTNQGGAATTTISTAVTSGSAQTVSLSASGLPSGAGASFNPPSVTAGGSSTLTLTTSAATPLGTSTVNVTGTGTSATHSTSVSLAVTSSGGGGGVVNGGFETGSFSGWTTSGQSETVVAGGHSGTYAARLGATTPTNGDSTMQQTVSVPSGGGTLSFWYQPHCPDTLTYDQQQAQIRNTSGTVLATLLNVCSNSGAWTQVSASLNAYAGQTIVLWFNSHDDNYSSDPTYTLFDDVAITASVPVTNPVVNGGFETGSFSGWTTAGVSETVVGGGHSGTYAARLGATTPTNGNSTMQQTITLSAGGGTLSFWYQPHCPDTLTYDQQQMQIRNTSGTVLATLLNVCSNSGTWTQVTASLSAYANQTIVLWFNSHDDNYPSDPTYTLFDDIAVQ